MPSIGLLVVVVVLVVFVWHWWWWVVVVLVVVGGGGCWVLCHRWWVVGGWCSCCCTETETQNSTQAAYCIPLFHAFRCATQPLQASSGFSLLLHSLYRLEDQALPSFFRPSATDSAVKGIGDILPMFLDELLQVVHGRDNRMVLLVPLQAPDVVVLIFGSSTTILVSHPLRVFCESSTLASDSADHPLQTSLTQSVYATD